MLSNCPVVLSFTAPAIPAPVGGVNFFNSSLVEWTHDGTNWNLKSCNPQDIYGLCFSDFAISGPVDLSALKGLTKIDFSSNGITDINLDVCALVCKSSFSLDFSDNLNLGYSVVSELVSDICRCYETNSGGAGHVNLTNTFLSGSISNLDTQSLYFTLQDCQKKNNVQIIVPVVGDVLTACVYVTLQAGCTAIQNEPVINACSGEFITLN